MKIANSRWRRTDIIEWRDLHLGWLQNLNSRAEIQTYYLLSRAKTI